MMWLLACLPLLGSPDLSYKGYRVVYSGSVKKELENGLWSKTWISKKYNFFWLHDIEQLVSLTVSKIYQRLLIHTLPNNILSATKMTIFSECVVWVNLSRIRSDRNIRNSSQKDPKAVIYLFWFLPCETLYEWKIY